MTDPQKTAPDPAPRTTDKWLEPGPGNVQIIYILYFAGFIFGGIPAVIGLVMAYLNRGKAGGFVESHYTWLIRTFWIGLLYGFVAALLFFVAIGFLLMLAIAVWVIIRLVKGLQALGRNEPIRDPQSWFI